MTRVIVVRHGQTQWNLERRAQGQTDIPISELGQAQAEAIGQTLATTTIHHLWSSDLVRAMSTAQAIARHHGISIVPEPLLREFDFGDWEGLYHSQVLEEYPGMWEQWSDPASNLCVPNGESLAQGAARTEELLKKIRVLGPEQTIVLVGHAALSRVFITLALEFPLADWPKFSAGVASIAELNLLPRGPSLVRLNDQHHLKGLAR